MKKAFTTRDDQDIPELKREQLGSGVRGKHFQHFTESSNVVVLKPEIQKAFPDSGAVNHALAGLLAITKEPHRLTSRTSRARTKTRSG